MSTQKPIIKFRLKNKETGKIIDPCGDIFIPLDGGGIIDWDRDLGWLGTDIKNWEIQQYLNIEDKNGVELYAGDKCEVFDELNDRPMICDTVWDENYKQYMFEDEYGDIYHITSYPFKIV